jgi:hypothetical protein
MRSSDRRTPAASRIEEEQAPPPVENEMIPPEPDSHPGPLEDALDRALDTFPAPPPESGVVDHVAIPPLRPVDSKKDDRR